MILRARNLVLQHPQKPDRKVLDGIEMHVRPGEVVGLLGPAGAGKSAVLDIMAGVTAPTSGNVLLAGRHITRKTERERRAMGLAYIPSKLSEINPSMTILANVAHEYRTEMALAGLKGTSTEYRAYKQRCEDALLDFGLWNRKDEPMSSLCATRQKLATVARAMIRLPSTEALLWDDPFGRPGEDVDPLTVFDVQQTLLSLRERGLAILITELNVREVLSIVDRAYILQDGIIVRDGKPGDFGVG